MSMKGSSLWWGPSSQRKANEKALWLRATCFSLQTTQYTLFIKMSLLRSNAFLHPIKCKRGNGVWEQKHCPISRFISERNKATCKAQPETRYMVCVIFKGGSFSKHPGLEIVLTYVS